MVSIPFATVSCFGSIQPCSSGRVMGSVTSFGVLPNQFIAQSEVLTADPSNESQNTPFVYPATPKGNAGQPRSSTGGAVTVGPGITGVAVGALVGGGTIVGVARSGSGVAVGPGVTVLVGLGVRVGVLDGRAVGVQVEGGLTVGVNVVVGKAVFVGNTVAVEDGRGLGVTVGVSCTILVGVGLVISHMASGHLVISMMLGVNVADGVALCCALAVAVNMMPVGAGEMLPVGVAVSAGGVAVHAAAVCAFCVLMAFSVARIVASIGRQADSRMLSASSAAGANFLFTTPILPHLDGHFCKAMRLVVYLRPQIDNLGCLDPHALF